MWDHLENFVRELRKADYELTKEEIKQQFGHYLEYKAHIKSGTWIEILGRQYTWKKEAGIYIIFSRSIPSDN